ncbi:MAG: M23 family metallopeptidase [Flavobacteriales bacterium]|nr:M23 family metallopeptidase [Flavobacteriales bacterium]MBK6945495.1 M23 family metallopeptidase [Flavobacteriales bacterium]MBK7241609.1 M23 family metallopeptidase [Flavobacteriales bacterium]MBK9534950.1 M23 family metallopeptidase [Flavobacteriales bacterium]MBP9138481.1 M23 family metallopeptidase [Flavobacteriales bacterium]
MDIPVALSGNFMEPRNNHFHSGLDMRTGGVEGVPVRAVADGWVSRIKISPWGYGKAVYIEHNDGLTTVYGHLSVLTGTVGAACADAQYRTKDFSIDQYLEKNVLPLKQGEVFALSGNSGGSGGPHLHFEIRNGAQHALDPQALGIKVKDTTQPEIIGVRLYPLADSSRVGPYPARSLGFPVQGNSGKYGLKPGDAPIAYGTVGLAIHTLDRYDDSGAKFGVRKIELYVDSVKAFSANFDHIDFNTTRYCNAQLDGELYKANKMEYHRCYKLPNNKLDIYGKEQLQGRITTQPGKEHHIRSVVIDANGNRSELTFMLKGATASESITWPTTTPIGSLLRYDSENVMAEAGVRLTLPALALYEDAYVHYERKDAPSNAITPLHVLHDAHTPIQSYCTLELDLPAELPQELRAKALIVSIGSGGKPSAEGGTVAGGTITTKVRSFGTYTVMIDTVPPTIRNVDLRANMSGRSGFTLKIADDLSGIDTFKASINGNWILMDYDPKTNRLVHNFDTHTKASGKKNLVVEVSDDRGNTSKFEMEFDR